MPIAANVTSEQITVSVGETQIDVSVGGGVGPTGSQGPSGTVAVSAPITNAGTSTAAVIGLSVGAGLAVSGGSLAVTYGTTAGTTCQGNDARLSDARTPLSHTHTSSQITDFASAVVAAAPPTTNASLLTSGTLDAGRLPGSVVLTSDARLTDAREWSAATVGQADAEAGTSTSRFAFTPQRVFQAIAAWWAGSAAKTKLDGIATGATANATDAQLRDRSTHTGTQLAATISDFASAVVAAAPPTTNASLLTSGTLPDARLSSNIARTSDVSSAVAAVVNAAPATLDTLAELAAALGSDANFSTTVTNALAAKAPIASPTFTGTVSGITKAMVGLGNVPNVDATARANHTGTQTASTISDFSAAVVAAAPPTTDASLLTTGTLSASRLPSTTVAAGSYGSASSVATFTVDAAGRLTAAGSSSIAIAAGAVSGLAAIATSGSASDLSAGTVPFARLPVGTSSTTVAAGNDARFTDARTPTAHVHSGADITSGTVAAARLGTHATTHNPGGSDPITLVEVYEFTRTTKPAAATGSNGSYTFTIPEAAKMVEFFAIGAGGGGGSGRRGAAGSARFGGGGGGTGGVMLITRTVAELASRTVSIVTGAGGAGGAARTTDDTNGNNGSNGIDTVITISGRDHYASRGTGGSGGTNAAGAGGSSGNAQYVGSAGASSSATAVPTGGQYVSNIAATGGAAGGGISTGDVSYNGGISRANGWFVGGSLVNSNGGTAPGGNGQNASDAFTQVFGAQPGGGGGGGAAGNATTAGGNGGNGANYGGAGGGGGASFNGYNSGAGGNGGDGYVRITVWY